MDRTGEGAGLERQEQACRALAVARDWEVVATVDDTISATTTRLADRPGWQRLVGLIEAGEVDTIVAWHLDRVTRSMKDLEALIELALHRGVGLATATGDIDLTTDVGRMVARILAAVAAAEVERKGERQVLAIDQRVAAGKPMWVRRPFGYELDGTLRQPEADALRKAYEDVAAGKTMAAVAREWTTAGFRTSAPTPDGKRANPSRKANYSPTGKWRTASMRALLRSPRNMGMSTLYGEVMGRGDWTPIVSEALWRRVDALLADRERPGKTGTLANLLSLIATCEKCGSSVRATTEGGHRIYVCAGLTGKGAGHVRIDVDFADGQVVRRMVQQMEATGRRSFAPLTEAPDLAPLYAEEEKLKGRLAELIEDRANDVIPRQQYLEGTVKLRAELKRLEITIAEAGRTSGPVEYVDIEAAYDEWDRLELHQQREYVQGAFESIRIKQRGGGRRKTGAPLWLPEHMDTLFTVAWAR